MIRQILKVDSDTVSISVPKNYIGKVLEIIAFTREEGLSTEGAVKEDSTFNALSLDTRGFKFDRNEANER
jgi:hypothetical protein